MKLWERVVEARLRKVVEICEQQYGFMPRKSTTDAIFALRILMERSRTVVRCAVGQTEEFKVEVGLHQRSALSPFLFAMAMDQLSEEVRQESPWTMMFADDIVICSESREQVEENLERWRFVLERRGMKVSRSKTEYMCVNEREGSGTVRLQGKEVKKVQEFKYLGSTDRSNGECGKEVKKRVQTGLHDLVYVEEGQQHECYFTANVFKPAYKTSKDDWKTFTCLDDTAFNQLSPACQRKMGVQGLVDIPWRVLISSTP
ncbi:hypothetical protein QTP70_002857 [Hemibagrus guttatus]|uniref:ribonuclease H n=1 Tax=Hemibagrus guttatus TaxID=175788 RepID=A0AAE0QSR8_9TELE|nr:hypothetical protein QTP70_002857 [Hemibagrus guttatus]